MKTYQLLQEGFGNAPKPAIKPVSTSKASDEDAAQKSLIPGSAYWVHVPNTVGGKPNVTHILWGLNDGSVPSLPKSSYSLAVFATTAGMYANDAAPDMGFVKGAISAWIQLLVSQLHGIEFDNESQLSTEIGNIIYVLYTVHNKP